MVTLAACGGSDDDSSSDSTATSAAAPRPTAAAPDHIPTVSGREKEYADALVSTFDENAENQIFTKANIRCLANSWIPIIGVDRLEEKGISPQDLASDEGDMTKLGLDETDATAMVAALGDCNINMRELIMSSIAPGATAEQRSCLDKALTTEDLTQAMVASYMGKSEAMDQGPLAQAGTCFAAPAPDTTTP